MLNGHERFKCFPKIIGQSIISYSTKKFSIHKPHVWDGILLHNTWFPQSVKKAEINYFRIYFSEIRRRELAIYSTKDITTNKSNFFKYFFLFLKILHENKITCSKMCNGFDNIIKPCSYKNNYFTINQCVIWPI